MRARPQLRLLAESSRSNLRPWPCLLACTLLLPAPALAMGGLELTHGSATVTQSPGLTQIDQLTPKAIFETPHLGLEYGEQLIVHAPDSSAYTLLRDVGSNPSAIHGRIEANDHLFLVNPNGILFGPTSQVSVHGLLATTLDIRDDAFLTGEYQLQKSTVSSEGRVVNQGSITAEGGGYIVLAGDSVENSGLIEARLGEVALAAGSRLTLDLVGDELISLAVDEATLAHQAGVKNLGQIKADGGKVLMTAKVKNELLGSVVNNEGVIQARTIQGEEGEIVLLGGMEQGTVEVGGILDASAPEGGDGGRIETSGHTVRVRDEATITTEAPLGRSGTWLIDPFDFLISATGGDMSGLALANALASNNVIIQSLAGSTEGNGDIFVNDDIAWAGDTSLTLEAVNTIFVNAAIENTGFGQVVLRSDLDALGDGTVLFGTGGSLGTAGGLASIYYNPTAYSTPTDYTPFFTPGTSGSLIAYMLVNDLNDLQDINTNLSGTYALSRNIDATATRTWNAGAGFEPLGSDINQFSGTFDGQHHTIANLFINRPTTQYVGLFGGCTDTASLRHIGVVNADITGGFQTGGLAAHMGIGATVIGSYTSGKVVGMSNTVGGLVGLNAGIISHSYSTAEVTGQSFVGGLAGANWGSAAYIKHSFSTGKVSGLSSVGGLVGSNYNTIPDPVVESFWDMESSGLTTSAGGTGKSTAEMKQQATFTNWDFTNTWRIYEGTTYPLLKSFLIPITLSITADDATRIYGDLNPAFTATFAGAVVDMTKIQGTLSLTTPATQTSSVGAYPITPGGLSSLDYDIIFHDGTLTVTPRPLFLSGLVANDKVYDGTTTATISSFGTLTNVVGNDEVTLNSGQHQANFDTSEVGSDKIVTVTNLSLDGASAGNYTIGAQRTQADITPAAPSPTARPTLAAAEAREGQAAVATVTSVLTVTPDQLDRGGDTPLQTAGELATDQQSTDAEDSEASREAVVSLEEAAQQNELGRRPLFSLDNGAVAGQNMVCK